MLFLNEKHKEIVKMEIKGLKIGKIWEKSQISFPWWEIGYEKAATKIIKNKHMESLSYDNLHRDIDSNQNFPLPRVFSEQV